MANYSIPLTMNKVYNTNRHHPQSLQGLIQWKRTGGLVQIQGRLSDDAEWVTIMNLDDYPTEGIEAILLPNQIRVYVANGFGFVDVWLAEIH